MFDKISNYRIDRDPIASNRNAFNPLNFNVGIIF